MAANQIGHVDSVSLPGAASTTPQQIFEIGKPFNPWHEVCGFYPPDIVGRQRDLTDGQKRLYERGVRWAGKNGSFWYGFDRIAEELGKSVRQVKDDMRVLEKRGLVSHKRRRRQSNRYVFLWHSILEVQSTAHQEGLEVQNPVLEVQDSVSLKCSGLHANRIRESCKEESSSSESPGEADGDDDGAFKNLLKAKNPQSQALLESTREELVNARSCNLAGIPDESRRKTFTSLVDVDMIRILRGFRNRDEFSLWVKDTVDRNLGTRAKRPTWMLYIRDAHDMAPVIAARLDEWREQQAAAVARAQDRAALAQMEAIAEQAWDAPVPVADAVRIATERDRKFRVPQVLRSRLERTGEEISPHDLYDQAKAWKQCAECGSDGLLGSALDRDLRFCECLAGEEKRFQDPDYLQREIDRVHADLRSKMVAAAESLPNRILIADALGDPTTEITDDGEVITIRVDRSYRLTFKPVSLMDSILWKLDLQRRVEVDIRPAASECRMPPEAVTPMGCQAAVA